TATVASAATAAASAAGAPASTTLPPAATPTRVVAARCSFGGARRPYGDRTMERRRATAVS
ncbi:hypothetical protein E4L73_10270, partial [Burkholderia pseudomallei]|nr:hypothetical protein [Burkholderia pseudomallei]MPU03141.1 hypothetical protein [Burkholderia pseudomallei]